MADRWIQLHQPPGNTWVYPIWNAIREAEKAGKCQPVTNSLSEIAVHVSTRLTMLPMMVKALSDDLDELYEQLNNIDAKYVFEKGKEGCAWNVDEALKYRLIAAAQSLLFEINACAENFEKFFILSADLLGKTLSKEDARKELITTVRAAGVGNSWNRILKRARNFAAHDGILYPAVDVSNKDHPEVVFLFQNVKSLDDPKKFISVKQIQEVIDGFLDSKTAIQEHLIKMFQ